MCYCRYADYEMRARGIYRRRLRDAVDAKMNIDDGNPWLHYCVSEKPYISYSLMHGPLFAG